MSIDSIDCIRSPIVPETKTIRCQCDSWTNTCVSNKMFDCIHAIDNIFLLVPSALSPCNNFLTKQCKQQHATKCSHIMGIAAIAGLQCWNENRHNHMRNSDFTIMVYYDNNLNNSLSQKSSQFRKVMIDQCDSREHLKDRRWICLGLLS